MLSEDQQTVEVIARGLARAILYICLSVAVCFSLSNCSLSSEVITECEESCKSHNTQMKSVTALKCICSDPNSISALSQSSDWVIPSTSR